MFGVSRQVFLPAMRVSSRCFTGAKVASQQNVFSSVAIKNVMPMPMGPNLCAVNSWQGRSFINTCGSFRSYSADSSVEKSQEAKASGSEKDASEMSSRKKKPTQNEKRIFVLVGKYKTMEEVPEYVSEAALVSVKSKFRIYVNMGMALVTVVAAIGMIVIGKSRSKKGESLAMLNVDRHPELYRQHEAKE